MEDQDNVITIEALDRQFGPIGAEPIEDVQEKSEQGHVAFLALTESESFDIGLGAAPSGLKDLRRLVQHWDPLSGGKRRTPLRQILVPDRCILQDLHRRTRETGRTGPPIREFSKWSGTTTTALDDDTKTAALEALDPCELEQHLAMNRARLITYEQVWSEIQAYIESRQLHRRSRHLAKEARKARRARKEKVMVRTSSKEAKVNVRTKVRIQTRTLFVGTAVRKAI